MILYLKIESCRGDPCGRPQPVDMCSHTGDRKGRPYTHKQRVLSTPVLILALIVTIMKSTRLPHELTVHEQMNGREGHMV